MTPTSKQAGDGQDGQSSTFSDTNSTAPTADALLVQAADGSGNEFAMGYDDSGCFWRFYAGARGAGSMLGDPVFHSESPEPLEALREYLESYLGVTEHNSSDPEANPSTASLPNLRNSENQNFEVPQSPPKDSTPQIVEADHEISEATNDIFWNRPKDRDSLDEILRNYGFEIDGNPDGEKEQVAKEEAKTAIRHLSTKEMLELIGPDEEPLWNDDEYDNLWCQNCNQYQNNDGDCWCKPKNQLRAELRAALTREENHDDSE